VRPVAEQPSWRFFAIRRTTSRGIEQPQSAGSDWRNLGGRRKTEHGASTVCNLQNFLAMERGKSGMMARVTDDQRGR
jgi:hypothetical protein